MRRRELVQQEHKPLFVLLLDEKLSGRRLLRQGFIRQFLKRPELAPGFAPALNDLLMCDPEQPTAESRIFAESSKVSGGVDKRFLNQIQTGLLITNQFEDMN